MAGMRWRGWAATMAFAAAAVLAVSAAPAFAAGTSYTWIGSAAGTGDNHSWTDANNWSPGGVPGTGDSVSIDSPDASHCTAHVDNVPTVTLADFSISQNPSRCGVSVNGGDLTVTDSFSWDGGTIATPMHLTSSSLGTITGANSRLNTLDENLDVAGTLTLSGLVGDGGGNTGSLRINAPNVLHVQAGGTLSSSGPNSVGFSSCCLTPAKIVNDGTIDVASGDFTVHGVEVDQNGALSAASAGRLVTSSAPLTAANGATYTGNGGWLIESGASARLSGTQNIGSGFHLELGGLNVNAGTQLGGTATLAGAGALDWTGGTIEGNLTIAHGMTVRAFGAHTDNGKRVLSGQDVLSSNVPSTLTNHGTMNFGNGATVLTSNQAKLVNAPNGTVSLAPGTQSSSVGCCTNPDRLVNNGTVVVPAGASASPVALHGLAYQASGGSTSIASGRTLQLSGGARGSLSSTAVNGGGTLALADPTTVSGPITVGGGTKLALQPSGSMDGTATIGGAGSLPWTGGAISGNVTVTAGGGVAVSGPDTKSLVNVSPTNGPSKLTVKAPTSIAAGTAAKPDLIDLGSSTLTLAGKTRAQNHVDLSHGKIVNLGSLTISPGSSGEVDTGAQVVNGGAVTVNSGTFQVDGAYSQTAGVTNLLGATHLDLYNTGRAISLGGGVLQGTGTIGGGVTNTRGTVKPAGAATGALHLSGAYSQGPKGTLAIDLGPKSRDLLAVAGAASLKGRLAAHNVGGYSPATGTKVRAVTAASMVDAMGCATTSGGGAGSGHWEPSPDATSLWAIWRPGAHTSC